MSTRVPNGPSSTRVNADRGTLRRRDPLEAEEMHRLIRVYVQRGLSDPEVAMLANCSSKTVLRHRKAHDIPANPPHKHEI